MSSRRKFLQGVAGSGLSAAALATFPPSIRKALAIPAFQETGTIKDVKRAVAPEVRVTYDAAAGGLRLEAMNAANGQVVPTVRSNQLYGTLSAVKPPFLAGSEQDAGSKWELRLNGKSAQSLYWNLNSTGSWYDFIVTCDADPSFQRRLAGRMETGRHSVTDPAMGLIDKF